MKNKYVISRSDYYLLKHIKASHLDKRFTYSYKTIGNIKWMALHHVMPITHLAKKYHVDRISIYKWLNNNGYEAIKPIAK